jgi:hypothetical protein
MRKQQNIRMPHGEAAPDGPRRRQAGLHLARRVRDPFERRARKIARG